MTCIMLILTTVTHAYTGGYKLYTTTHSKMISTANISFEEYIIQLQWLHLRTQKLKKGRKIYDSTWRSGAGLSTSHGAPE